MSIIRFRKLRFGKVLRFFIVFIFALCTVSLLAQTRVIERPAPNPFQRVPLVDGTPTVAELKAARSSGQQPVIPVRSAPRSSSTRQGDSGAKPRIVTDINQAEIIEPSDGSGSDEIAINFEAVDLMSLVRYLSQETGRGFIINQALQGSVTIISPVTLSKDEALAMLESILQARGYTAVQSGRMYKIVALADARVAGTETRTSEELFSLTDDDTLVTQIVPLRRTSVEEASRILQTLLPRDSSMLLFPPSNTIVLTGRSVSIKRALEILSELESGLLKPELDIVPLKFSAAEDLKGQLETIISTAGVERDEIRGGVSFIADRRSNSLLVLSSPENFDRIRELIERLDTSSTDTRPELTKFFSLKYANEADTVRQLEDILGFKNRDRIISASESAAIETTKLVPIKRTRSIMVTTRSEAIMGRVEELLQHLDMPPEADSSDVKVVRVSNADARTLAETLSRLVQQRSQNNPDKSDSISFVAEEHTNSIIMTGPPQQFSHYETIVKSLDMMRPQILVEVLITEVSGQLTHSIGVEWNNFEYDDEDQRIFGGTNYGLRTGPLSGSGFQVGLVKGAVDVAKLGRGEVAELSKIRAMVKAYRNNSDFNILSAPQILATDNEEAKISVGEVVALPQGFTQDRDTGRFDLTNFKYEDVGIVLTLTPRVNSNDLVTLKINQEIKKRQEENLYEFNVPVLTKRQMETTITVPDRQTIVIGGLMREDETKVVERVPLLSNIPFIGEAFKNRRTVKQKTNLLVFLTPHILSTPEEVTRFELNRMSKTHEQRLLEAQELVAEHHQLQRDNLAQTGDNAAKTLEARREELRGRAQAAFDKIRAPH